MLVKNKMINEMNLLAKNDEMNLLAEKMMNEFISKYCTCSFIHGEIFTNCKNTKVIFPQLQCLVGTFRSNHVNFMKII